ncbi:hypothetical protein ElyMa_002396100 [Elysia marginata]|uniref:Uncharacterized protein n=1 Tax=Elysia marginata TaxID=1093978 RepID=A0AAV4GD52_9GAST|nr:hypothetical protein ElyMa_002396100 [Elysia marginata]
MAHPRIPPEVKGVTQSSRANWTTINFPSLVSQDWTTINFSSPVSREPHGLFTNPSHLSPLVSDLLISRAGRPGGETLLSVLLDTSKSTEQGDNSSLAMSGHRANFSRLDIAGHG